MRVFYDCSELHGHVKCTHLNSFVQCERFVKPTVLHFGHEVVSIIANTLQKLDWAVQGVISSARSYKLCKEL